jgi:hypothetical protein
LTKVPAFIIYLFNFLLGLSTIFILLIASVHFFGVGFFNPPLHPPPLPYRALAVLLVVVYFSLPILVTKWLISDSPYTFEYRIGAFLSFTIGFIFGFSNPSIAWLMK